jgi:hypothetical protein
MKTYLPIWMVLLAGAIAAVFISELVSPATQRTMMQEGGWIETASWLSYFVAAAFVLIRMTRWPVRWNMAVVTLLPGVRELDFDRRFTTMDIFKSRLYFSADFQSMKS